MNHRAATKKARDERAAHIHFIEAQYFRTLFRQRGSDVAEKLARVGVLRDAALQHLAPVLEKIPRSDGTGTGWNLTRYDDVVEFSLVAPMADISPSQKSAANLLRACAYALEEGALFDSVLDWDGVLDWILPAYAGLDIDNVETGFRRAAANQRIAKTRKKRKAIDEAAVLAKVARGLPYKTIAVTYKCSIAAIGGIVGRSGGKPAVLRAWRAANAVKS